MFEVNKIEYFKGLKGKRKRIKRKRKISIKLISDGNKEKGD